MAKWKSSFPARKSPHSGKGWGVEPLGWSGAASLPGLGVAHPVGIALGHDGGGVDSSRLVERPYDRSFWSG